MAELHDRRPVWVRDLPTCGRPVTPVRATRVWCCPRAWCPRRTWTQTTDVIAPRALLTARARAGICRRVGKDPARLAGVTALGLDQTAFTNASAIQPTSFVTGIVDLTRRAGGAARLLDVLDERSASALVSWINQRDPDWRAQIRTAALERHRGYAAALRTALPRAVRLLDAVPTVRLGCAAVDDVRRRIQQQPTGHRGCARDPLYGIRRLLRRGDEHHSPRSGRGC